MPDDLPLSATRPVTQLIEHLSASGSYAEVPFPPARCPARGEGRVRPVCAGDTHWNGRGAFIAYKRLMAEVETRFAVNSLTDADVAYSSVELEGDLGHKVEICRGRGTARTPTHSTGGRVCSPWTTASSAAAGSSSWSVMPRRPRPASSAAIPTRTRCCRSWPSRSDASYSSSSPRLTTSWSGTSAPRS